MLSLLATHDPNGEVLGLDAFPRDQWPEPRVVHPAFQLMVGAGTVMMGLAVLWAVLWLRGRSDGRWAQQRRLLWTLVLASPLGFLALEAGWVVTEAGRQPWVIYGVMRTSEAVTPAGGVAWSLTGFTLLYLLLIVTLVWILRRLAHGDDLEPVEAAEGRLAAT